MFGEPTQTGLKLIERWTNAEKVKRHLVRDLAVADEDIDEAVNALGRWMAPGDMKVGETICVWHGNSLIAVKLTPDKSYEISVRKRGEDCRLPV